MTQKNLGVICIFYSNQSEKWKNIYIIYVALLWHYFKYTKTWLYLFQNLWHKLHIDSFSSTFIDVAH